MLCRTVVAEVELVGSARSSQKYKTKQKHTGNDYSTVQYQVLDTWLQYITGFSFSYRVPRPVSISQNSCTS